MQARLTPTILLVEDSPDDAFIFERALVKTGEKYRLFAVNHGTAAVEYLKCISLIASDCPRPDIIFLDLKLPQLSGFDVLKWIKEQSFSPPLHVIVLSGSDELRDKNLAQELGAAEFFTKPISIADLKQKITEIAS